MILVDGEKYACQQCIRGHRSSSCKHIKRTLVLVRSRGRPSTDSFQRIAIYAEELKDKEDIQEALKNEDNSKNNLLAAKFVSNHSEKFTQKSCCGASSGKSLTQSEGSSNNCCSNKNNSIVKEETEVPSASCQCCPSKSPDEPCKKKTVFILKASKRHVFNVEKDSLRLLDPVVEVPNSKVGLDIIQKVSKNKKLQSCRSKDVRKEYIQNLMKKQLGSSFYNDSGFCCGGNVEILKADSSQRNDINGSFHQFKVSIDKTKTTVTNPPHDKDNVNSMMNNLQQIIGNNSTGQPTFSESSTDANSFLYDLYVADSCTVPGSCSCDPDKCACPDCTEHGKYRNSNLTVKQQFEDFEFPSNNDHVKSYGKVEVQSHIPQLEQTLFKMLNDCSLDVPNGVDYENMTDDLRATDEEECICEPDRCCCFNCEKHGIVDGIRRDGTFAGIPPFEINLTNMQYPIDTPTSSKSTPVEMTNEGDSDELNSNPATDRDQWLRQHEAHLLSGTTTSINFNN
ncbi:hypothetical protein CANINC_001399 [Pichia inconspicua]|uniref:Copper-fist domain-containing protein n=1 Tax=Pichia inconspicua TaxID=52247 RepID=A0A4V4NFZ9_9ASCO|nr:hypothetical protein CANINC_001399 [[Candida] inconspicua]